MFLLQAEFQEVQMDLTSQLHSSLISVFTSIIQCYHYEHQCEDSTSDIRPCLWVKTPGLGGLYLLVPPLPGSPKQTITE